MIQRNKNLVGWIKLDGNGTIIPGSCQFRPIGHKPKDGNWKQLKIDYCCGVGDSIIVFQNTTGSADITNITTADNSINWIGTLNNNQTVAFMIPFGYDQTWSVTIHNPTGRTLTTSNQYNYADVGVITPSGAISVTGSVTTFTTSASAGSQYLVVLS